MSPSLLVVDDDPPFRRLAVTVLESWGHDVIGEAGTAREALLRTRDLRPDVVLADIGLPDGDGFALTEALLALEHPPAVVLVSSDGDAGNDGAAGRAGARGFVPKVELVGPVLQAMLGGTAGCDARPAVRPRHERRGISV